MKFDNICIIRKLNDPHATNVHSVVTDIEYWCTKNSVKSVQSTEITSTSLVVAIGGDGTVIQASKYAAVYGALVLGFNLGKVGFLADFKPADVLDTLDAAFNGLLKCEDRTLIEANYDGKQFVALNDIVVSCATSDTSFAYDLLIDDSFAGSHKANGVIVSTATGSTAYALNVGGAIIMPTLDVMQVTPIAAQTLTSRPLIVGGHSSGITIKFGTSQNDCMTIRADGRIVVSTNEAKDVPTDGEVEDDCSVDYKFNRLTITRSPNPVKLLHHHSWNHFDILNQKLGWV